MINNKNIQKKPMVQPMRQPAPPLRQATLKGAPQPGMVRPGMGPVPMGSPQPTGYNFGSVTRQELQIEDKVAHLSLQVNQIIIRPYLQQALDYLRTSKHDAEIAYNQLSDEIAQEVKVIQKSNIEISQRIKDAKMTIEKTQNVIRNKYNNSTEDEIASGQLNLDEEYNLVADQYELAMQLSQELTKYKMRVESLIETQSVLDNSVVARTSELQVEIDNLDLLLHNFDASDYADVLASKKGIRSMGQRRPIDEMPRRGKQLNSMVDDYALRTYDDISNVSRFEEPVRQNISPYGSNRGVQQQVSRIQQQQQYGRGSSYVNASSNNINVHNINDVGDGKMFVVRKGNPITTDQANAVADIQKTNNNAIKVIR